MPIVTTRCVVLQTYRYSDTSKILRLMTRDLGPRSAIARGALRPRSRLSGLLEPFCEGRATLYLKEGRDLHTLSDFELLRDRQSLGRDLPRFAGGSVLCELVMRLAPEERDRRLYADLVRGLDALVEASPEGVRNAVAIHLWRLVATLGFEPRLDACVRCGRRPGPAEAVRFDRAAGGLRCARCGGEGTPLEPAERRLLQRLAGGGDAPPDVASPETERRQIALVADFVRYHVAEGARLRSLDFLAPASPAGSGP